MDCFPKLDPYNRGGESESRFVFARHLELQFGGPGSVGLSVGHQPGEMVACLPSVAGTPADGDRVVPFCFEIIPLRRALVCCHSLLTRLKETLACWYCSYAKSRPMAILSKRSCVTRCESTALGNCFAGVSASLRKHQNLGERADNYLWLRARRNFEISWLERLFFFFLFIRPRSRNASCPFALKNPEPMGAK